MEDRQRDWPEWLAIAEFVVNNKVHLATKVSLFITNYGRELRIEINIRILEKVEKVTEFVKRMRKVQEKARAALRKAQEEMKQQADEWKKEVEIWKKGNRVMLSMKDLVFRERPTKKLTERYMRLYMIEEVVSKNIVKLKLLASIRIHPVVNVSRVVRYRKPEKDKKKKREVMKYLVW